MTRAVPSKWLWIVAAIAVALGLAVWGLYPFIVQARFKHHVEGVWFKYIHGTIPSVPDEYAGVPKEHWYLYWSTTNAVSKLREALRSYPYDSGEGELQYLKKAIEEYEFAATKAKILVDPNVAYDESRKTRKTILANMIRGDQLVQEFLGRSLPNVAPMEDSTQPN